MFFLKNKKTKNKNSFFVDITVYALFLIIRKAVNRFVGLNPGLRVHTRIQTIYISSVGLFQNKASLLMTVVTVTEI